MSSVLEPVATALTRAFMPLRMALADPSGAQLTVLFRQFGWNVDVRAYVGELPIVTKLPPLITQAEDLVDSLATATDSLKYAGIVLDIIELVLGDGGIVAALEDLKDDLPTATTVPEALRDPVFWSQLAADLPDHLMLRYLEVQQPVLHAAVRLLGLVKEVEQSPSGDFQESQVAYVRRELQLVRLFDLLQNPVGTVQDTYGWSRANGASTFGLEESANAVRQILRALRALGTRARTSRIRSRFVGADELYAEESTLRASVNELDIPLASGRPAGGSSRVELGFVVLPVPETPGDDEIAGLYVGNLSWGAASATVQVADDWQLVVTGEVDTPGAIGVLLYPGKDPEGRVDVGADGSFSLVLTPVAGAGPWRIFGGEVGTRLESGGAEVSLTFSVENGVADVVLGLRTLAGNGRSGLTFVLDPTAGDPFLGELLGGDPIEAELDAALSWSARNGFVFEGSAGFEFVVWIGKAIGPIHVECLTVTLDAGEDGVTVEAGLSITATLGPFSVLVGGVGLRTELSDATDGLVLTRFGDLGVSIGFMPPNQVGFEIEANDVIIGGGFVRYEPELGRYSGALALEFVSVGLSAIVVVDTRLPGNPDGWALFASLFATFPSLPLGFGFFLSGVGGIVCLNRAMDTEALASGLRSGAVDAILFPDNVLEDAPYLISQLDGWFPLAEGSSVFGVAATITWGTPKALITGEVGIMLSVPDFDLALLGSISMALPDEETAQLELHMDTLGAIDPAERTVMLVASLYDSSLLRTIQLSGDMAMYGSFGANPYFLLSIGGYHPSFEPPGSLPAAVVDLRPMGFEILLSEDIWFGVYGYVAVTSNTLQFGADATLRASTTLLGVTYSAIGSIGFDVLLVFSPFSFAADAHAQVEVTAGSTELIVAELAVHLEGPQPWYATAYGRFEFLGVGVRFDIAIGGAAGAEAPPRRNVLDLVEFALREPGAWHDVPPSGQTVLLADDTADDEIVRARPDAELQATQTVAPLERELDVYGIYTIDGPTLLDIDDAGLDGAAAATWEPVSDWFAPALYDSMTRVERLAAPSYESMTAGVRITPGSVVTGSDTQSLTPDYEVKVVEELEGDSVSLGVKPLLGTLLTANAARLRDPRLGGTTRSASLPVRYQALEPTFTLVDATTGAPVGQPKSYRAALGALHTRVETNVNGRGEVRVVPSHAAREGLFA